MISLMKILKKTTLLFLVVFLVLIIGDKLLGELNRWRVDSQLTPTNFPTRTEIKQTSYSFAVISDIHSDLKNLQRVLDRIREDKISFIVVVGDLTTLGKSEELIKVKTVLDKNAIPYYVVPGNHDLWSVKGKSNPYKDIFGVDYQSFLKDNVKFILINNGDGTIGIDNTQREWITQQIVDCPKLHCLVFAHMPLNNGLLKHIMGEDSPRVASQAASLVRELVRAQVVELFAGHLHYLSTYTLDDLTTITDGAVKDNPRFIEVTVTQPETRIEEKQIWLE